jgi:hypothetical protein
MTGSNPTSMADHRERLVLACQLDRLNLQLAARKARSGGIASMVLDKLQDLSPSIPGRIGTWSRALLQGTVLLRGVYNSMKS